MGLKAVKDFLVGALIGVMSMLPGASGGTMAVVFGIYERLIADVADIRHKLLKDLRFIVPVAVGIVLGLVVCAVGLDALLQNWEVPMMFFFAVLILCQIPDIYKLSAGDQGEKPSRTNIAACVAGFIIMLLFLAIDGIETDAGLSFTDMGVSDVILLFIIGVVIALSKVVPGLSGASILLAIGLYIPLMDLIGDTDLSSLMDRAAALIPIGVGLIVGVLGLAKVVDWFFTKYHRSSYFFILGMTGGSIVTVVVQALEGMDGTSQIAACVVAIVAGLVLGYVISRISYRYARENASEAEAAES